jgi:sporulation protein YlmC with PRC-barrel domain
VKLFIEPCSNCILVIVLIADVSKLIGKQVIGAQAMELGEVESVKIDTSNWKATHLGVKLSDDAIRELGFTKTLWLGFTKTFWSSVVISLPVSAVSVVGDVITLVDSVKCLEDVVERLGKK